MRKTIIAIISALIITALQARAQDSTALWRAENQIAQALEKCANTGDDARKTAYAAEAANLMEDALKTQLAFGYEFPLLKSVSKLRSDDGLVRVITFGVGISGGRYIYHGFVMYQSEDLDDIVVTRLKTARRPENDPENANMQSDNWYGAIYYEISQFGKKSQPVYALCGWDGHDQYTNRKVVEQLTFDDEGTPVLGGLFQSEKGNGLSRLIFEFNERAMMTLKYIGKQKLIVGDHLDTPATLPQHKGKPRFMGPDGSYDGFYYKDGRWHYVADVDITNQARP
ncbi:MAG: hypothetical protein MJZ66_01350 [Bacteroidales bacterium]|nr:hypothetical protein [Bacteroidales bacterium]